jgi:hypothetical protein
VPVDTFELYLPEGKTSALAANGDLCSTKVKAKLVMPTIFVAQNGAQIKQNIKINVTGCPRAGKGRKASRARAAARTESSVLGREAYR